MTQRSSRRKAPWYADGLDFKCTACGACCTGAPGYVWVEPADVERLAKHKGIDAKTFTRLYVRRVGRRLSLKERSNGDCVMLEGERCSVYAVKPTACSTFPFWDEVLESKETWEATKERCEGIGQGDRFTAAEIDVIRRGVPGPLLDRQEAAKRLESPKGGPPPVDDATWSRALAELESLYTELDGELRRYTFQCRASGDCCDFDAWGHRLYATTLEAEHFFRHSPEKRANENPGHCPAWGKDRLCSAREGRMLGCRTFFCITGTRGDPHEVHERYYRRVKEIHDRHGIPFRYADITAWAAERRPANPVADSVPATGSAPATGGAPSTNGAAHRQAGARGESPGAARSAE